MPTIRHIRIIRHSAVPDTGSYEVKFADGRPSRYFYFDDIPGRRLRPDILTSEQALITNGTDLAPLSRSRRSASLAEPRLYEMIMRSAAIASFPN